MCRLAGYVGQTPLPLSALLYEPPHSLEHAAFAPNELINGTINVDGTGVAWWPTDGSGPLRYVTTQPPWADPNLPGLAPALFGRTVLGAVRSATPGLAFGPDNVHPFVVEGLAGAHNGSVRGFRQEVGRTLLSRLSDRRFGKLTAMNDSLALVLLVAQELEDERGSELAEAVTAVIQQTAKAVMAVAKSATLNLVVAAADQIVAVRTSAGYAVNSLYTRTTADGNWFASEALDEDDAWVEVPKHSIAVLTPDSLTVQTIEHEGQHS